jgi:hypothetical protein
LPISHCTLSMSKNLDRASMQSPMSLAIDKHLDNSCIMNSVTRQKRFRNSCHINEISKLCRNFDPNCIFSRTIIGRDFIAADTHICACEFWAQYHFRAYGKKK